MATAKLMRLVIDRCRQKHSDALLERVRSVGRVLTAAQPREIAVGNVVRRMLGMIREEAEEDRSGEDGSASELASDGGGGRTPWDHPASPLRSGELSTALGMDQGAGGNVGSNANGVSDAASAVAAAIARPPLVGSQTSYAPSMAGSVASMFDLLSVSQTTTPGTQSPVHRSSPKPGGGMAPVPMAAALHARRDIKDEVMAGVNEIIDELDDADAQIAAYAPEHIHSAETVLVHGSSQTVQRFLLRAAAKRKFTVIHAEAFPNNHLETYAAVTGKRMPKDGSAADADDEASDDEDAMEPSRFAKPLIAAGVTVVLIPDAAIFALMSRVNKVILGTHGVLANGGLVAAAGARVVAQAARAHRTPVVVVSAIYKLSPLYPFDFDALIEYGDSSKVLGYEEGELVDLVDVVNPLFDYVPPELVDLYITNL